VKNLEECVVFTPYRKLYQQFGAICGNDYSFLITKISHGDEHKLWKPSQPVKEIPAGTDSSAQPDFRSSEQSTASTVPSPGRWRSRSHSSTGNSDGSFDMAECRVIA
jgi:hypothetical protein